MNKNSLRQEMISKRKNFYSNEKSLEICKKIIELPAFINANTVMLYMRTKYEVDTSFFLAYAYKAGKKVCAPKVLSDTEMSAVSFNTSGITKGFYNIWEPQGEEISAVDFVVVPGLCFDYNRNRLGYGKGYYDRFLRNKQTFSVGVCFEAQMAEKLPVTALDIPVDIVVTESEIYT